MKWLKYTVKVGRGGEYKPKYEPLYKDEGDMPYKILAENILEHQYAIYSDRESYNGITWDIVSCKDVPKNIKKEEMDYLKVKLKETKIRLKKGARA